MTDVMCRRNSAVTSPRPTRLFLRMPSQANPCVPVLVLGSEHDMYIYTNPHMC